MLGIRGVGLARASGVAAWSPNRLTGAAFTADQILPAFSGSYDVTTNATRIYFASPSVSTQAGGTVLSLWIKGTAATIKLPNGANAGAILVSVDGGAYATCANAVDVYTLFTGLTDTPHFVSVRIGGAYGLNNVYANKSGGNILNVTGADPYIDLPSAWSISCNATTVFSAIGAGSANVANFYPPLTLRNAAGASSNTSTLVIRGNFQKLNVSSVGSVDGAGSYAIWVSVDGAAPTRYAAIASVGNANAMSIAATAGVHTYYVWASWRGTVLSVAGDATAVAVLGTPQLHQFGDSITYGNTERGNIDTFRIGPEINYLASTYGISGLTTVGLDTDISTWLANTPVTSSDVAILAIGRNDSGSFTAPVIAAYTSILNKLVAKGYGKILARGILPTGNLSSTFPTENAAISSIVTTLANPNVIFVDTSTCPAYTTDASDNTHPDTAGYVTVATYLLPKYRTALGL